MELTTPEPVKVPVIEWEFTFENGRGVSIHLWPTLGDTLDETEVGIAKFHFPRLKETQMVFKGKAVSLLVRESLRVYVDPALALKRMQERKEQAEADGKK